MNMTTRNRLRKLYILMNIYTDYVFIIVIRNELVLSI